MDTRKYSTLMDAVADVPDPRKRRGTRHPWALILTLISAALVCGQHRVLPLLMVDNSAVLYDSLDWLCHLPILALVVLSYQKRGARNPR